MNRIYHTFGLLFALGLIFLSSCFKPIEIDLPKHETKLVINSLLSPDLQTAAFVGISGTILEDEELYDSLLKSAQLNLITANGERHAFRPFDTLVFDTFGTFINNTDTFYYVNQRYQKGFFPEDSVTITPGETYRLEAVHSQYGMASASIQVPQEIPLQSVSITRNAAVDLEGYSYAGINLEFDDPGGIDNYYSVEAYILEVTPDQDSFYNKVYLYDLSAIQNSTFEENRVLSDKSFDGKKTILTLYTDAFEYRSNEYPIFIRLNSITESYYRYAITYDKFLFNQDIGVGIFSNEPISVYSNIENGYGVLMGMSLGKYVEIKE